MVLLYSPCLSFNLIMSDKYLKNIIEGVCKAAKEHNIGNLGDIEDTTSLCKPEKNKLNIEVPTTLIGPIEGFIFMTNRCHTCNGYYGPNFDDTLCSTCHAFLYPTNNLVHDVPSSYIGSSDSDSGNEELDDGQESLSTQDSVEASSSLYEELKPSVTITVDSLTRELQRLSEFTPPIEHVNIELLPPEVLMITFEYLDEISLWCIGQVCTRWKEILDMCVRPERWREYTLKRWPLLPVQNYEQDWYEFYTAMMKSSCCLKCVRQMAATDYRSKYDENSWRKHRLLTEIRSMKNDPLDGIEAQSLDNPRSHWQATIEGPAGSPYEGGLFFLYIQVPPSYPLDPPVVRFITKIFHPNVSRHGDIGIDSIHHNWSLALTISKLLISIQSLLTDPYCDVCMEPKIGEIYEKNRHLFNKYARQWTAKYAMHDLLPH